jgi:putative oxidoreductase
MNLTVLQSRLNLIIWRVISSDLLAIGARMSLAAIFFLSARTKVDGWFHITDNAFSLFEEEYHLPLIAPVLATYVTVVAEHVIAMLLFLGLGTRIAAFALLCMTLVIQLFVFPGGWPTHLTWATLALYLINYGGGRFSVDRQLSRPEPY